MKQKTPEQQLAEYWQNFRKDNNIYCDINHDIAVMLNKYFMELGLVDFIDRQAFVNKYYPVLKDQYKYINTRQATELVLIIREHLSNKKPLI